MSGSPDKLIPTTIAPGESDWLRDADESALRRAAEPERSIRAVPAWSVPETLTAERLSESLAGPRPWLSEVITAMVFAVSAAPKSHSLIAVAERQRAAAALFEQAREGAVALIGALSVPGGDASNPIPASYFDKPRTLGHAVNSIETDLSQGTSEDLFAVLNKTATRWLDVRVDRSDFIGWIETLLHPRAHAAATASRRSEPAIELAARLIEHLWPIGIPNLRAKQRNEQIRTRAKAINETPPSERSIRRALQARPELIQANRS